VIVKVNLQLSSDIKILDGDYGIIIGHPTEESASLFDYLVICNGVEVYLFKHEIILVNK
tara:strand:- start:2197 stop:2373 length:177 start_codon:yes stop_codon:yes gene_type:complete